MNAESGGQRYDVFVSYASPDRAFAKEFNATLGRLGLRTFMDHRELQPGIPWIEALEKAIEQSLAVVILLGWHGLGNVQQYERDLALVRQSREQDFPVIPVLIPGCDTPPTGFLELLTWIDLRPGLEQQDVLANLVEALRGQPTASAAAREAVCPYMGLEPFREEDAAFFCGRSQAVAELVGCVSEHTLVAVVGRSGSGKSSLVFAGLLPELRRQRPGVTWDVLVVRPGASPLHNLAAAFEDEPAPAGLVSRDAKVEAAAAHLRDGGADVLVRLANAKLDAAPSKPSRLLVYIDQWEELYSMGPLEGPAKERHARDVERFIALLLSVARQGRARTRVVLTVRADFYGSLLGHPSLSALVPRQQVNIGPMSRDDLLAAIVTPAKKVGLSFEPVSLVDEILDDAGTDEAVLPLLQYALKETWAHRRRDGRALTAAAYTEAGGVSRAIQTTADRTYKSLNEREKAVARSLFLGLVTPGEGREDTRARIAMPDDPEVQAVVAKFTGPDARLLVTGSEPIPVGSPPAANRSGSPNPQDPALRATVEVAHEALIRTWPELRFWLDANRDMLRSRAVIVQQRRDWESNGRRPELLLASGFPLERGRELLAESGDVPVDDVRDFVELSTREDEGRVQARRDAELVERRRLLRQTRARLLLATVGGLMAVFFGLLAGYAFRQRAAVQKLLRATEDAAARELAGSAILASRDVMLERETVANALRAAARSPVVLNEPRLAEAGFVAALRAAPLVGRLHGHSGVVYTAAFSPDGSRIITASFDQTARIWDAESGQLLTTLQGHSAPVYTAAFSGDGSRVVTASADDTARLWDVKSGQLLTTLQGHSDAVHIAAFSPDGSRMVTASSDHTARLWDAKSGQLLTILQGHSDAVHTAAFSADGSRVVTASSDHTARLWDAKSGQLLTMLRGHSDTVYMAAFSPDGSRIVTASADRTARIWDAKSGQLLMILQGHSNVVNMAAFSPDGSRVVTASNDATARLWDTTSGQLLTTLQGHFAPVFTATFSSDGLRVVTASGDATARVWAARGGQLLTTLEGLSSSLFAAAFSPDGLRVVTASLEGTARIWDIKSGQQLTTLQGHSAPVYTAAFSGDGSRIVTASNDHTAGIWDATSARLLTTLQGHSGAVNTAVFSPDGSRVVTASGNTTARLWDTTSGRQLTTLRGHSAAIGTAAFSPDGLRVVTASYDGTARLWDARSGQLLITLQGHSGAAVNTAAFSPDGSRVVTASTDSTAGLWDSKSGDLLTTLQGHSGAVITAAFSPDGSRIVTASYDHTARLWKGGQLVTTLEGHSDAVRTAAFSPDGSRVVTASDDNTARLWDVKSGQLIATLQGHSAPVHTATFSSDGLRIVTASSDHTARIWDPRSGQLLATLEGHSDAVTAAAFSPDGSRVVTASGDNTARLWPGDYKSCLPWICKTIKDSIRYMGPDYQDLAGICDEVLKVSHTR